MEQGLKIEDVIEKEYYVDRHGIKHPNKKDGVSIYFTNRVEDLFLDFAKKYAEVPEEKSSEFIEAYGVINNLLIDYPRKLHKDSNLRNFLWGNKGNVVAIDFERLTYMPPQLELVKLLEFGKTEYITEEEIDRLLGHYIISYEMIDGRKIDRTEFIDTYHAAGTHNHLCLAGYITSYFHIDSIDKDEFFVHLERSKDHLKRLITSKDAKMPCEKAERLFYVLESFKEGDIRRLSLVDY